MSFARQSVAVLLALVLVGSAGAAVCQIGCAEQSGEAGHHGTAAPAGEHQHHAAPPVPDSVLAGGTAPMSCTVIMAPPPDSRLTTAAPTAAGQMIAAAPADYFLRLAQPAPAPQPSPPTVRSTCPAPVSLRI